MSLTVIKSGIFDSVQDLGRKGFAHWGINPNGAMDLFSSVLSNYILGNKDSEPVLEIHFPAPVLQCTKPVIICITGANFSPQVNHTAVPLNTHILLQANDTLSFKKHINGRIAYLGIQSGIKAEEWLKSASTNTKLKIGGIKGKLLQKNDSFSAKNETLITSEKGGTYVFPWKVIPEIENDETIFVLPGKDWNMLKEEAKQDFISTPFSISSHSDRMGYYLTGKELMLQEHKEMISFGVHYGTIQLLPNGQLITLMADHQTTGGYPCIANVITTHRNKLAQMPTGSKIAFTFTDIATAEQLHLQQQNFLTQIQTACALKWETTHRIC